MPFNLVNWVSLTAIVSCLYLATSPLAYAFLAANLFLTSGNLDFTSLFNKATCALKVIFNSLICCLIVALSTVESSLNLAFSSLRSFSNLCFNLLILIFLRSIKLRYL